MNVKQEINNLKQFSNLNELNVVCAGLYNHGKSSLLNMLVDDFNEMTFKVADKRETSSIKEIKKDNLLFVDTPGLDALNKDDDVVSKAIKYRDVVMFVHNVATGELVKNEIEFIKNLKKEYGENVIIVLSRIDQVSEEILYEIENKIKEQLKGIFYEVKIYKVSVKRYKKGKFENKQLLVQKSGVEKLKNDLFSLNTNVRKNRIKQLKSQIEIYVNKEKEKITQQISKIKKDKEELKADIEADIKKIVNNIKSI